MALRVVLFIFDICIVVLLRVANTARSKLAYWSQNIVLPSSLQSHEKCKHVVGA